MDSNQFLSHAHPRNLLNILSIPSFLGSRRTLKVNGNNNMEVHVPTHMSCHLFLVVFRSFFFVRLLLLFLPPLLILLSHYNHHEDDDGQERSSLTFLPRSSCRCYNAISMQQVLMTIAKGRVCSLFFPTKAN